MTEALLPWLLATEWQVRTGAETRNAQEWNEDDWTVGPVARPGTASPSPGEPAGQVLEAESGGDEGIGAMAVCSGLRSREAAQRRLEGGNAWFVWF